ncbi:hypothetical protein L0222_31125, partial [bacterium]|nr:hypothetical protein [bacterium]
YEIAFLVIFLICEIRLNSAPSSSRASEILAVRQEFQMRKRQMDNVSTKDKKLMDKLRSLSLWSHGSSERL